MKIRDVRTAPERRAFASAVTVIVVLAVVSLVLEWKSGSDFGEIASSFATFGIILSVAAIHFFARSSDPEAREKLWITAVWNAAIELVARLLPGAPAAPSATPSPSPAESLSGRLTEDDRVRRDSYD